LDDERKSNFLYEPDGLRPRRHLASFGASIAAHVVIVGLIVLFVTPLARTHHDWVLAYLVDLGDGGRGGARAGASGAGGAGALHREDGALAALRGESRSPARHARRRVASEDGEVASVAAVAAVAHARPQAAASAALSAADGIRASAVGNDSASRGGPGAHGAPGAGAGGGAGGGASGSGDGIGNGGGGDANSLAHADYGSDPAPIYPESARRREQQGTVTVRVLVGADGSVEQAEIADSSGFDTLDDAAIDTVRLRWRFVPARRDGLAIETWVLVPIRFALVETDAVR